MNYLATLSCVLQITFLVRSTANSQLVWGFNSLNICEEKSYPYLKPLHSKYRARTFWFHSIGSPIWINLISSDVYSNLISMTLYQKHQISLTMSNIINWNKLATPLFFYIMCWEMIVLVSVWSSEHIHTSMLPCLLLTIMYL